MCWYKDKTIKKMQIFLDWLFKSNDNRVMKSNFAGHGKKAQGVV